MTEEEWVSEETKERFRKHFDSKFDELERVTKEELEEIRAKGGLCVAPSLWKWVRKYKDASIFGCMEGTVGRWEEGEKTGMFPGAYEVCFPFATEDNKDLYVVDYGITVASVDAENIDQAIQMIDKVHRMRKRKKEGGE